MAERLEKPSYIFRAASEFAPDAEVMAKKDVERYVHWLNEEHKADIEELNEEHGAEIEAQALRLVGKKNREIEAVKMAKEKYEKIIAEADKVIAELEQKLRDNCIHCPVKEQEDDVVSELKKQVHDYAQGLYVMQARAEKELRHHKYKRCLDNARIALDDWHLHNSFYAMGHQEFEKRKCEFYDKWRKRWLELSEKFKEAK